MNTRETATYIVGHNGCPNINCSGFGGLNNGKVCPFKCGEYDCEKLGIFETAKKWLADHPINEKCDHCLSHKLPDIRFVERKKHITPDTVSLSLLLQQKEKCDLCGEEFWVDVPKEYI